MDKRFLEKQLAHAEGVADKTSKLLAPRPGVIAVVKPGSEAESRHGVGPTFGNLTPAMIRKRD